MMKKLELSIFSGVEVLSRAQLKKVMGGEVKISYNPECLPDCEETSTDCNTGFSCVEYDKEGCNPLPKKCVPLA